MPFSTSPAMEVRESETQTVNLTASFRAALDAWRFVDAAYGDDMSSDYKFIWRLDYQRADFLVWAERFGFFSGGGYNSALDRPATRSQQVKASLDAIFSLFDADAFSNDYGVEIRGAGDRSIHSMFTDRYTKLRDPVRSTITQPAPAGPLPKTTIFGSKMWLISDEEDFKKLIRRAAALVSDLDELTRDIETDQTAEKIAHEAISWFVGPPLEWIEKTSPGYESLVTRVAVKYWRDLLEAIPANMNEGMYSPSNASERRPMAYYVTPGFKFIDSSNRLACKNLIDNIPVPNDDDNAGRTSRILEDLKAWNNEPLNEWVTMSPVSESNLDRFLGSFRGPDGTPYEGGVFHVCIEPAERYPFEPPRVWFVTKIVHPKIDWQGTVLMDILQDPGAWTPALSLTKLLVSIALLLDDPNWDRPAEWNWPADWACDSESCRQQASEWTRKFATGRIVYPGAWENGFCNVNEDIPAGLSTIWDMRKREPSP